MAVGACWRNARWMVRRGEVSAARPLLRRNLSGVAVTADALFTQRQLARPIRARRGHDLMVVKANQPEWYDAIALLFDQPPWTRQEQAAEYQQVATRHRATAGESNGAWDVAPH
jgi:hypothetical protein